MSSRAFWFVVPIVMYATACSPPPVSKMETMHAPDVAEDSDDDAATDEEDDNDVGPSDANDFEGTDPEPGWGDTDLSCETDADCGSVEFCLEGTCRIDRCSAAGYTSTAPLGGSFIFYGDREFGVVDSEAYEGTFYADMYSPSGGSASYASSLPSEVGALLDIAGGDFLGEGEESYVAIARYGTTGMAMLLDGVEDDLRISLTFEPRAVDAGDLDGDGRAEVVTIGEHDVRICDFVGDACIDLETEAELIDVAAADVDGDGIIEPIFLQQDDSGVAIWVENLDAERTGQAPSWTTVVDLHDVERISAGDLDGDGQAEIVVFDDKGFYGTRDDHVVILALSVEDAEVAVIEELSLGYGRTTDIAVGDTDADGVAELIALDSDDKIVSFTYGEDGLEFGDEMPISVTGAPSRIAIADHDDDSPRAELVDGPEVVTGAQVPIVLLYLPPFSTEYSSGFSYSGYGLGETYSESYTDTVSLSINADVGVRAEFLSVFKSSFTEKVAYKTSQTLGTARSIATGGRSSLRSDPETFGLHYGAVVVSWGCFHAYTYEMVDINGYFDETDGEPLVLTVPVDGGTAMLSTNRYNAMAAQIGDMPQMPVPYTVGDPTTYPTEAETIYGDDIPDEDFVFPATTWYEVSDVGYVGWFNQLGDTTTESSMVGVDMGASANVTVAGISVGAGFTAGWGQGYSVSMGETALFMGGIPPFVDDPETVADEYVDNFYRVAPIVYRQGYTDVEGNQSSFFVSTYMVDL